MSQLLSLLIIISPVIYYFKSIYKIDNNIEYGFYPLLLKILIGINVIGLISFLLPWINLPIIGSKNAIDITTKSFTTIARERTIVSIVCLSFLYLILIIGNLIQLNYKKVKNKKIIIIESIMGLICSAIAINTIISYNELWTQPSDNFLGDALSASFSIGFGLYLITILGVFQLIAIFSVKK